MTTTTRERRCATCWGVIAGGQPSAEYDGGEHHRDCLPDARRAVAESRRIPGVRTNEASADECVCARCEETLDACDCGAGPMFQL